MNDNLKLQIKMIDNKIARLMIQRDFYLKLTESRNDQSIDQHSTEKSPGASSSISESENFKH